MAQRESDREDLMREATALVERIELRVPGEAESVVAGFRRDGSASFYFGAAEVYQFNSLSELRRSFVAGLLFKSERGKLVSLDRQRAAAAVELMRRELSAAATADLLDAASRRLDALRGALNDGTAQLVGQHPASADVKGRLQRWLGQLPPKPIVIADSPHAR